jgi:hypothetical protein
LSLGRLLSRGGRAIKEAREERERRLGVGDLAATGQGGREAMALKER